MNATRADAITAQERHLLARARDLARNGRGRVSPNPLVGALVVRDGHVVGEGWHEGPGTAHAEVAALAAAGTARGATVICSLEPCSHHGRTPPCTEALIAAEVSRVVIGCLDPLEVGRDGGMKVLENAGIDVVAAPDDEAAVCREVNAAFITHAVTGRPLVTLKLATSLDGKVATARGETRWITGPEARGLVHRWRADSDAVAVGIGTALADDPALTARDVDGDFRPPVRVVFDAAARLPIHSALVRSAGETPVLIVAGTDAESGRVRDLRGAGVDVVQIGGSGAERITRALDLLGERGVQSLLLEGGPTVADAFLACGAVDRLAWFIAPILIGGVSAPGAIAGTGLGPLAGVPRLARTAVERVGDDVLIHGELRPVPAGASR